MTRSNGIHLVATFSILALHILQVSIAAKHTVPLVTGCGRGGTHSTAAMLASLGPKAKHEDYVHDGISVAWPYGAPIEDGEYIGYRWEPAGRYPFEKVSSYEDRVETLSKFKPVVLLVRDPLSVISSTRRCFCARGTRQTASEIMNDGRSWKFVEHNLNLTRFIDRKEHGANLQWSDLPYDSVLRSMVYWYGWNNMVEERRHDELAGYGGNIPPVSDLTNEHVVRLEDPDMLFKVASKLGLEQAVVEKAKTAAKQNDASGKSSDADKKAFGMVTWQMAWDTAPKLAQKIWNMAQRYGYYPDEPSKLLIYLKRQDQQKEQQD